MLKIDSVKYIKKKGSSINIVKLIEFIILFIFYFYLLNIKRKGTVRMLKKLAGMGK